MVEQKFDALDINKNEESLKDGKKDLNVLNLKEQKQTKSYDKLEGTGVNALRTISGILIVLGVILSIAGIIQIADGSSYHPERTYMGMACFYIAVSCFVLSPVFKVLATIGEAAKIYKDKNT
jgi:hypothetical protein